MASQRTAYQKYIKCIENSTKKSFIRHIPLLKRFAQKTREVEILLQKITNRTKSEQCLALKEKACQLCLCCKDCPCNVSSTYIKYVVVSVGVGVLVLLAFARFDVLYGMVGRLFPSPPSSSSSSSSSSQRSSSSSKPMKKKLKSPLCTLTKKERDVVKKAIRLWGKHNFLPTKALQDKLLQSTKVAISDESSRSSLIASMLVIFALIIALLESSVSETLIHFYFSLFSFLVGPTMSKAIAMLSLTVFFTITDFEGENNNNNNDNNVNKNHRRRNDMNPWYEYPRIFSFYAFVGATILSAVDTGTHAAETSVGNEGGSRIWYLSFGLVGTFAWLCLEHCAPFHFVCEYNWPVFVSMGILAFSDKSRILLVLSCLALVAYGLWMEGNDKEDDDDNEYETITMATRAEGSTTNSLEQNATAASEETDITKDGDDQHYRQQQHENIGTFFLLVAALMCEIDQRIQNVGAILAMMSTVVIKYGMQREKSSFQGIIGTVGLCIATYLSFSKDPALSNIINMPISLILVFIPSSILLGGWNEVITPSIVSIPPKTFSGMHDALLGITLALLLILCIVGNSSNWSDWKFNMDFGISDSDDKSYFKLVDGEYSYHNRGIYMFPWSLPLFLYYRALYKFWPEQELKCRRYRILQNGVMVVVVSHLMRLASWAELFLIVAWLISVWPKLEVLLRGGK